MKKALLILILSVSPAHAVKLCKYDPCRVIDTWKSASGGIGSHSYDGMTWSLSVTASPTGTVAGSAGCFSNSTSATGNGSYCWCRVTSVNGNSCTGDWKFYSNQFVDNRDNCPSACASSCGSCSGDLSCRSTLFSNVVSNIPNASSVTCPLTGTCANTNYKTVGNSDSCGSVWVETMSPTLTLSGTDTNGTYSATCTK